MKMHLKIQGKTFNVIVGDIQERPIKVEVDGDVFEVWPQEMIVPSGAGISQLNPAPVLPQSTAVKPLAQKTPTPINSSLVQAPIPGVIIEINVKPGDSVTYGQELCVLEAMKMKNSIRAGRDGVVKSVFININGHVHQSQHLIEFENEREA